MNLQTLERRIGKSGKISRECRTMLIAQLTERRQLLADLTPGSR